MISLSYLSITQREHTPKFLNLNLIMLLLPWSQLTSSHNNLCMKIGMQLKKLVTFWNGCLGCSSVWRWHEFHEWNMGCQTQVIPKGTMKISRDCICAHVDQQLEGIDSLQPCCPVDHCLADAYSWNITRSQFNTSWCHCFLSSCYTRRR